MQNANREFELKFDLTGGELEKLAGNPRLRTGADSSQKTLRSVYYDTPDHRLHAQGITLRVRGNGEGFIQTVKMGRDLADGISNPIEVENRLEGLEPSPASIPDKSVRRAVKKAIGDASLTQAFETVILRTAYKLQAGGSVIEVALDKGEALALDLRSEICEAELELISGSPKDLLEIAHTLFEKGPVRLSVHSKAERGYQLLQNTRTAKSPEPSRAEAAAIETGQTCGGALAEVFRKARQQIVKNRDALMVNSDPECAHQLRVGLTRLRAAIRGLRQFSHTRELEMLEADAQAIGRAVGRLRDADVLIGEIYAPAAEAMPDAAGLKELNGALKKHRTAMRKEARQALSSELWTRLLLSLTLWPSMIEREPQLQCAVDDCAGAMLKKRWKKSAKLGRSIDTLEEGERHEMRKSLKKLRYTAEFLAPLYSKSEIHPFIKRLKKLQDIFGYVNDVRMAGALHDIAQAYCGGGVALEAATRVLGHHDSQASEAWREASTAWYRLRRRGRFWE